MINENQEKPYEDCTKKREKANEAYSNSNEQRDSLFSSNDKPNY